MLIANAPAPVAPVEPQAGGKLQLGDILVPALWLAGALFLTAMLLKVIMVFRDYQRRKSVTDDSVHGQLTHFRLAFERGEMNEAEYDRVYKLLTGQVRKKAGLPPQEAAATQAPPPAPPTSESGNGQIK